MRLGLAIACLLVFLNGCLTDRDADGTYRIAVVGDSNSVPEQNYPSRTSWVDWIQSEALLPEVHALKNGSETRENVIWGNGSAIGWACVSSIGGLNDGEAWVGESVANHADAIIVAAGTNDLVKFNATPQDVVNCYLDMQTTAAMSNVELFVATTPPIYPPYPDADSWNDLVNQLNALIRATFNPKIVIDFDSGFTADMYLANGNGLHLNDTGQQLRAQRAADVVRAAQV